MPTYVIDTPAGVLPRPTTQTTIIELVKWLKQHEEIKTITFVSNQPYVKYQEAVIREVIKNLNAEIEIEVVGSACSDENAQPIIEALGSYIFAVTPEILIKFGGKITDPALIESFKALYAKQPLIYQNLKHNLFE